VLYDFEDNDDDCYMINDRFGARKLSDDLSNAVKVKDGV